MFLSFFLSLPPHHFLSFTLSQALKGLLFYYFCLLWFSLSGICPPLSSLGDSPCSLCEPRNSWQLHFPSCVLPSLSFCLCACTRAWEAPSQAVTRFESYSNCRWSQTLHPSSQQLLPWRRAAPAWWQRPSSEPQSTWESPELRALTHIFTTRFVWALQLHIPCTALLLLCAGFLLL